MRVNVVEKSNKDQGECGRCRKPIPKGSPYRWIKGRYTARQVRCMDHKCAFRRSEMTGSKLSALYSAQETAEETLLEIDPASESAADDIKQALSDLRDSAQEVADEYRESADNIRENFSESSTADECDEKADEIENWLSEVESVEDTAEEWEPEDFDERIDCIECKTPDAARHQGEGKYACGSEHEHPVTLGLFTLEAKNADGQTRFEFHEELREQAQNVINDCSL